MPLTRLDLPAPETPVTTVNTPSGKATSMSLRLFSRAPAIVSQPLATRRVAGATMPERPDRYAPVGDARSAMRSRAVPWATTEPPFRPAPGPMSMIQSAARMIASSCSTTRTELPMSRRRASASMSRWLSRWWRPIDGSSRM